MEKFKHPLRLNTKVYFQISNEPEKGTAVIVGKFKDPDDGHWSYELDVIYGDKSDRHRENGKLIVNDFEIKPLHSLMAGLFNRKMKK